jgi:hypothetical protein
MVDRSRGEKLVIEMDISFPRVPCYRESHTLSCVLGSAEREPFVVLSLDVMDISGEHQTDLEHEISKTRLSKEGKAIERTLTGRECLGYR